MPGMGSSTRCERSLVSKGLRSAALGLLLACTTDISIGGAADDDAASVEGGKWRSILPTGTSQPDVTVAPYRLDRRPVTNAQFLAFTRAHPAMAQRPGAVVLADASYLKAVGQRLGTWATALPEQPVVGVSWFAARAYCEARDARLPNWYEWEFAAAADETHRDARDSPEWQQRILAWYSRPSNEPLAAVGQGSAQCFWYLRSARAGVGMGRGFQWPHDRSGQSRAG